MYDSTTPQVIPVTAKLILTYIDGNFKTDQWVAQNRPQARRVPTTTSATGNLAAQIFDCERGDGNAQDAALWAWNKLQRKERPTIYCSRIGSPGYGWSWVLTALAQLNIPSAYVDFGIADYTGTPHLVPGSAFTQYANPTYTGANYDLSLTNGIWPNVPNPAVLNKPACAIVGTSTNKGYYIFAQDGGVFAYGDAVFHGSLPSLGITPAQPVVDAALTTDNGGYWMVGADGGVFSFGNAQFYGAANK